MRRIYTAADTLVTLLAALGLAIVIWVIAVRIDDPVESRTFIRPISLPNLPPDFVMLDVDQETAQIVVEGPSSVLNLLSASDFTALADLTNVTTGQVVVPVQVQFEPPDESINPDQVQLSTPVPSQVLVDVDRLITADVPVVLTIRGDVARGYERESAFTDPETLQVTGPSRRVNQLAEARVTVILDNAREDLNVSRRPIFYDQSGNIVSVLNLTISHEQIQVIVPITQLAGFASKPVVVNFTGVPAPSYRLLNVTVVPDSVLVTGTPAQLDALGPIQTELIDIDGLRSSFTQQVALDLPPGIELEEVQAIIVTFEIEPILSTLTVRKEPEVRGLSPGLTVTLGLDEIRVVLFGPLPVLDSLREDDVRVTLDLFGLDVGTHSLEPIVDVFAEDVEVRSTLPTVISVIISDVVTATNGLTSTLPSGSAGGAGLSPGAGAGAASGAGGGAATDFPPAHRPAALVTNRWPIRFRFGA